MAEEKQSLLYKLKPITDRMPAVLRPEGHVHFRTKLMWVIVILLLYFSLTNIWLYGLERANVVDFFSSLRAILAVPQVFGFLTPAPGFVSNMGAVWAGEGYNLAITIIVLQLVAGSYLVFLMDEVVSKWGIGSGISLFIAAGVSQQIFTGTFNWYP